MGAQLMSEIDATLCSIEAEQALLGAVLMSAGKTLDIIDAFVTSDDFSEALHRRLPELYRRME